MARANFAPTLDDIARLAAGAFASLPEDLRAHARDVAIRVEEFPDEAAERALELESPFDLLGLYRGVPLTERGAAETGRLPDVVFLYRRPLLDHWCETGESLEDLVRHVLIHEIGHHFGFSDDDMERIEDADAE